MLQLLSSIEGFDVAILLFIQEHIRNSLFDKLFIPITHFSDDALFWVLLVLVLLWSPKTRRIGAAALISMVICYLLCSVWLKDYVARIRPYDAYNSIRLLIEKQDEFSFPSGHSTMSFASSLIYVRMMEKPFGTATLLLAILIAFSRLYVGVHYPSDVLAGFLLALVVSTIVYAFFHFQETRSRRR